MANHTLSYINRIYEEALGNDYRPQKNFNALISHTYPPPFIQVMDAFTPYEPLDQAFAQMDLGSSSSAPKLSSWNETASKVASSGSTSWGTWSPQAQPQIRERIHHRFVEFDDPLSVPP